MELNDQITQALQEGLAVRQRTLSVLVPTIAATATAMIEALREGHKILIFGNGGSAAEAQHFSGELAGRYRAERTPLAGIALSTDTSTLTCIGNDYGYEQVFSRQIHALAQPGDIALGLTTSGRSRNVIEGLKAARERSMITIALTGEAGVDGATVDHVLAIPARSTARVQEEHLAIIHCWCDAIDEAFVSR
jgi:D-sedoheptulose 7-phosphate isomerase